MIAAMLMPVNSVGYAVVDETADTTLDEMSNETPVFNNQWYSKPNSYAKLVNWYKALESEYPGYIEVFKANELYGTGEVDGGYDLYYVRITNESLGFHKPEVLFLGSPHGDETAGTVGLYWFTDWLMRMAFTDEICQEYSKEWLRWLMDHREIYIEISHNPYGFDHVQRFDINDWDLNREADCDGPGPNTGDIWGSVNGKTLRLFIDDHLIRVGCDFHGGVRMLLYPWSSTHDTLHKVSPITGKSYSHVPPDFNFFDALSLRLGDYIGSYGGVLNENTIGPIPDTVGYEAPGGICPWAYGADVEKNPVEDPYVDDERFGNYPGCGIFWISPEISKVKDPSESSMGNDTIHRYGAEVRRFVLHQTDIAQPYIRWMSDTPANNTIVSNGSTLLFQWQVNGSLVVDNTSLQWSTNTDPIHSPEYSASFHDEYAGMYVGGTGWDNAQSGYTNGVVHVEAIDLHEVGDYYFVVKAKVDQIYRDVIHPEVYGDNSYLRLIQERTNDSFNETLEGADGLEKIQGQLWWFSPVIHITVIENMPPGKPEVPIGPTLGMPENPYSYTAAAVDPEGDDIQYGWDFDDGNPIQWGEWCNSGEPCSISYSWDAQGNYSIRVKARDTYGGESNWSDPLFVLIGDSDVLSIDITNPENALYIQNVKIRSFLFRAPLIIGYINITVDASSAYSEIEAVRFYIDGELEKIDNSEPYSWQWDETSFGRCTIKVVAYDEEGNQKCKELIVWRFF